LINSSAGKGSSQSPGDRQMVAGYLSNLNIVPEAESLNRTRVDHDYDYDL